MEDVLTVFGQVTWWQYLLVGLVLLVVLQMFLPSFKKKEKKYFK